MRLAWLTACLAAVFSLTIPGEAANRGGALENPDHPLWNQQAPARFEVRIETSKGTFRVEARREWAPLGVDRFYNMVRAGFFDDTRFFRVVEGFIAQFGIPGEPSVSAAWNGRTLIDDPVRQSNKKGWMAFAMTGPHTRSTQIYINLADNVRLDAQGFAPFARVIAGMEVVERLHSGYGEDAGGGMRRGRQDKMLQEGNVHLDRDFPLLDRLFSARIASDGYPQPAQGDFTLRDFRFESGERLEELRLHYTTIGSPVRDEEGVVRNAVLIMHGTTGNGRGFLRDAFAGQLFGTGQLLDATKHFIILPDAIGHGKSSRPSDGLRMRFPNYSYNDMVRAQYRLLTEHLGVNRLRLVMGTSMGGMHTWVWGYTYPDFVDALMPMASLPVEIAGRNRMMRKMIIDSIRNDPEWNQGNYDKQPRGLVSAVHMLIMMVSSPLQWQKSASTRQQAEDFLEDLIQRYAASLDANDMIYQFDSSRDYNPSPHLHKIQAPVLAVNSADDQVNPPELGILQREIRKVEMGRAILIPTSDQTRGHGTHSRPAIWGRHLAELLAESEGR